MAYAESKNGFLSSSLSIFLMPGGLLIKVLSICNVLVLSIIAVTVVVLVSLTYKISITSVMVSQFTQIQKSQITCLGKTWILFHYILFRLQRDRFVFGKTERITFVKLNIE